MEMRVGVCGIACERCPKMTARSCPHGEQGCTPMENRFCEIATCAFRKGKRLCFECEDFPCENTKKGPVSYGYCLFISGRER